VRIVVAPDKFQGSATAAEAAAAIAAGLRAANPDLEVVEMPVADGGDGTVAAALAAGYRPVGVTADGPTGVPVATVLAMTGTTVVVELADVVGLRRLPGGPAPLTASTYGLGQVIAAAIGHGATKIVLGLGGSSSTDGGAGMMQALGVELADAAGAPLARGGAALANLARIDLRGLPERLSVGTERRADRRDDRAIAEFMVASDVDNPLLGAEGAAAVFAPQKGASPADVQRLESGLARWSVLTTAATGRDVACTPGAGAAGGTGYAALAYLEAQLRPGIEMVLDLIGFDGAIAGADLVITGEGSLDRQTLGGKAPLGVARVARRRGVPVVAVAGRIGLGGDELARSGFADAYSLADIEPDLASSMARVLDLLWQVGGRIAGRAQGPLVL
jgi:glycerate kinase